MLRWLEKRFGWLAVPNVTAILIAGQVLTFLVGVAQPQLYDRLLLIGAGVMSGEVWRLLTFIFLSPVIDPAQALASAITIIFFLIYLQLLWLFGQALEGHWGTFRFNLFLLVGYLLHVAVAFIVPGQVLTNGFLYGSMFLAFAFLYPDYVFYLFFILPVKVKWLALISWIFYGASLVVGDLGTRLVVIASVANFFLFFWPDIIAKFRTGGRRVKRTVKAAAERDEPFHKCVVCGRTERSHPKLEFRYCPQCTGAPCYCEDHIHDHPHR